jgi:probable rRNA maturation factor
MNIEVEVDHGEDIVAGVDVQRLATYVLEQEGQPANTEVSITFVDDQEIHRLNKEYRGIDRPTDVLSFELDGYDDDFDDGDKDDAGLVPDDEPFLLGDIVIATDVAKAQTAQFGTTPEQELHVLLVHGLLHLCGWDHVHSDEEAEAMEARERELLAGYGMPGIR